MMDYQGKYLHTGRGVGNVDEVEVSELELLVVKKDELLRKVGSTGKERLDSKVELDVRLLLDVVVFGLEEVDVVLADVVGLTGAGVVFDVVARAITWAMSWCRLCSPFRVMMQNPKINVCVYLLFKESGLFDDGRSNAL